MTDRTQAQKEASRENGKQGGRPIAKEKSVVLEVRFTKAEREVVVKAGGSKLIKKLLIEHGVKVFLAKQKQKPLIKHYDKIDPAVLLELSKIGNNLNQLAKWCNTHKSDAEAITVVYELAKIEAEIKAVLPQVVYQDAH